MVSKNTFVAIALVVIPLVSWAQVWTEIPVEPSLPGGTTVFTADIDDDGDLDVLGSYGSYGSDGLSWWENTDGTGTTWTSHVITSDYLQPRVAKAADFDGDGDTDVVATGDFGATTWWENIDGNGTEWTEWSISVGNVAPWDVDIIDLDQDGDLDLLTANYGEDKFIWWENEFTDDWPVWTPHNVALGVDGASKIRASDIDGDGDTDVIGIGNNTSNVAWYENVLGDGSEWAAHPLGNDVLALIDDGDMDGDGDADLVAMALLGGNLRWYENTANNDSLWVSHLVGFADVYGDVHAVDMDNDGDTDILGADSDQAVLWWENVTGDGITWTVNTITDQFSGANHALPVDLDLDGDMDALGVATGQDGRVSWWQQDQVSVAVEPAALSLEWPEATPGPIGSLTVTNNTDTPLMVTVQTGVNEWLVAYPMFAMIDPDDSVELLVQINGIWPDNTVIEGAISLFPVGHDVINVPVSVNCQAQTPQPYDFTAYPTQRIVMAAGGLVDYRVDLYTNVPQTFPNVTYWTTVELPNGTETGPQFQVMTTIPANADILTGTLSQQIPAFAPPGTYLHKSKLGYFPNAVLESWFPFTKFEGGVVAEGERLDDWTVSGTWPERMSSGNAFAANDLVPAEYKMFAAYPNPFNPTTTVTVGLPVTADLRVTVFNVAGQQVAELVTGTVAAGTHSYLFDGSGLASGIYFVHATVPGELNAMQKIMLVK